MNVLLDTCTFLWALEEPDRLPDLPTRLFSDPECTLFLSAVSVWEIAIKCGLGKLDFPDSLDLFIPRAIRQFKLNPLPLDVATAILVAKLPPHHKDPFDRMLVCQAMAHKLTILTPDRLIRQYGVPCLW